jgi:hypothetical protein
MIFFSEICWTGVERHRVTLLTVTKTARIKATEELQPVYGAAPNHQYNVASFATVRVLSRLHSSEVSRTSCNDLSVTLQRAIWWRQLEVAPYDGHKTITGPGNKA